jgi:hypothetical protein
MLAITVFASVLVVQLSASEKFLLWGGQEIEAAPFRNQTLNEVFTTAAAAEACDNDDLLVVMHSY